MIFRGIRGHDLFRMLAATALLSGLALTGIGCDANDPMARKASIEVEACGERRVQMGVASSLREVALALALDLEAQQPPILIEWTFGASSSIAQQLRLGAPLDLVVVADQRIIETLLERELIDPRSLRLIARGSLLLVARADSPLAPLGVDALRSPLLERLGLPGRAVPLGRYGRAWLEHENLLDDLEGKLVVTENARATLAAVNQGHVDLALVYETDFRLGTSLQVLHRPDARAVPEIRYVAARASAAPSCPQIGRALESWRSATARARLAAAGFQLPDANSPARSSESTAHRS